VTAKLLAEASQALAERDLEGLRTLAATAPVTRRSGKSHRVSMRRGCSSRLRDAVRHWARTNARTDPYGRACYWAMRASGHGHERALRGLADRLLACLIATLRDDVLYDPARRARHLTRPMAA
jgi:transposase